MVHCSVHGMHHPFFELRPPPGDIIAAVLSVAPQYFCPTAVMDGDVDLDTLVGVCRRFGGNMREISSLVAAAMQQLHTSTPFTGAASAHGLLQMVGDLEMCTYETYAKSLGERIKRTGLSINEVQERAGKSNVLAYPRTLNGGPSDRDLQLKEILHDFMVLSASVCVRDDPFKPDCKLQAVGPIALDAMHYAAKALMGTISNHEGTNLNALTAIECLLCTNFIALSGEELEIMIGLRLCLQSLSHNLRLLQDVHCSPKPALRRTVMDTKSQSRHHAGWTERTRRQTRIELPARAGTQRAPARAAPMTLKKLLCRSLNLKEAAIGHVYVVLASTSGKTSKVDAAVSNKLSSMREGELLIIHTAPNAPFCDYVLYYKANHEIPGDKHQVVFVEVTKSTLVVHARGKLQAALAALKSKATALGVSSSSCSSNSTVPASQSGSEAACRDTEDVSASSRPHTPQATKTRTAPAAAASRYGLGQSRQVARKPPVPSRFATGARRSKRVAAALTKSSGTSSSHGKTPSKAAAAACTRNAPQSPSIEPRATCKAAGVVQEEPRKQVDKAVNLTALGDIIALVASPKYVPEQLDDGSWSFKAPQAGGNCSLGNAWLRVLGAPLYFHFAQRGNGHRKQLIVTTKPLPRSATAAAAAAAAGGHYSRAAPQQAAWEVSTLHVTAKQLKDKDQHLKAFKHLNCGFAYAVFSEDLFAVTNEI
jgi:hypothetical protein